jgi:peptidoglycan-associated lipoprotein
MLLGVNMRPILRAFLAASVVTTLVGCSSGVKLEHPAPITSPGAGTSIATPANVGSDELNSPSSPLAKRSVYFDFDSSVIKSDYKGLLEAHARYLSAHLERHVLIQGNTDERGPSEYNLALGERRSVAVLRYLEVLGVSSQQLEAVSLGKEKPRALGHDEASWAENRRADLVYR